MHPDDMEALRGIFRTEARELLMGMERAILMLESTQDPEVLKGLFRAVHTLKGNCLMMGFPDASELVHSVEDLLQMFVARTLPASASVVTLLLQSVDALRMLLGVPGEGRVAADVDPAVIQGRLMQTARAGGTAGEPPVLGKVRGVLPEALGELPAPERTLRVGLDRLDRLLDLTGEIAISRGRLTAMLEQAERHSPAELLEAHQETDRLYLDLQELVLKARLVPIGRAFQPFARTLWELGAATGKQVRLETGGEDVEVDTTVVELIRDPLTHLVRNAVDHGIELPGVRQARGKPPTGTLRIHARQEAGAIVVQVSDDGVGLNRERILQKARATGLLGPNEERDDAELFQLIFAPGFSTAERITELSGRGIGMDVVWRNIEMLRGSISIETREGAGTSFTLRLPLTLSIIEGFCVGVGEDTYVLPLENVFECVELPLEERGTGATGLLHLRGHALPYLRLREHFAAEGPRPERESVVIVGHGRDFRAGLAVDSLLGQAQTVIKPLSKLFQHLPGLSGSAILGTGRVALVLDVSSLLRSLLPRPFIRVA
ncbi:chemotaxis protein CheA [Stigmatella sp. ncwal1]|uniref:Chemotaxis protein CheA n=1 Tax=Stigmatella ashevillensis TaxID=2995309 RepID=A0ABT5D314_9BACT|nr:chemotaxis protein CheA [Stigmatella ashevillena]MDC0708059.1 chemotaxis protein CheA [Stigmatella ashevillena]